MCCSLSTTVVIVLELLFNLGLFELVCNLGLCIYVSKALLTLICRCALIGRFLLRVSGGSPLCFALGISGGCDALW